MIREYGRLPGETDADLKQRIRDAAVEAVQQWNTPLAGLLTFYGHTHQTVWNTALQVAEELRIDPERLRLVPDPASITVEGATPEELGAFLAALTRRTPETPAGSLVSRVCAGMVEADRKTHR